MAHPEIISNTTRRSRLMLKQLFKWKFKKKPWRTEIPPFSDRAPPTSVPDFLSKFDNSLVKYENAKKDAGNCCCFFFLCLLIPNIFRVNGRCKSNSGQCSSRAPIGLCFPSLPVALFESDTRHVTLTMTIQTACDTLANRTARRGNKEKRERIKNKCVCFVSLSWFKLWLSSNFPVPLSLILRVLVPYWPPDEHFLPPIFTEIHCSTPWFLFSSDHSAWNQISDRFLFSVKGNVKVTEFSRGTYSAGKWIFD